MTEDPVPMLTLKYSTLKGLSEELFRDDPPAQFSVFGMGHAFETKCFPPDCTRKRARAIIHAIGHTVLYVDKKQCDEQERFKFKDERLDPIRMVLCFMPYSDTPDHGRLYMLKEGDVRFYKALEVPALA